MPMLERQLGSTSEIVAVFIPNSAVDTGLGLANVSASSLAISWWRTDMTSTSTYTAVAGTLGTWGASTIAQVNSTFALGWYQVSVPNGVFALGDMALMHLYGYPNMAPVPVIFDITRDDNQQYSSSKVYPVGVSSATVNLGISSAPILLGVSTLSVPVGVSSYSRNAGVSTVAVLVGVSTLAVPVGVSSASVDFGVSTVAVAEKLVGVSTIAVSQKLVGVSTIAVGEKLVGVSTIAVGEKLVGVSTIAVGEKLVGVSTIAEAQKLVGVSTVTAAGLTNFFDTGAVFYSTAVISSVVYEMATNVSATVGGLVGVSTITTPVGVSSASVDFGVSTIAVAQKLVGVSTIAVGEKLVGVSTIAAAEKLVGVSTVVAAQRSAIADAMLVRNVSSGGDGGRTVSEALFVLRNKVDAGAGVVYATDDTTTAWSFTVSTMAGEPIVTITPV